MLFTKLDILSFLLNLTICAQFTTSPHQKNSVSILLGNHNLCSYREKPNKMQECIKILLFLILNEAQHVSGDTPPIVRSLTAQAASGFA